VKSFKTLVGHKPVSLRFLNRFSREDQHRGQLILLHSAWDDYVGEENPVRIVDALIGELDSAVLGFAGVIPEATGCPSYRCGLNETAPR
jgi:hypothetical protein